jgi:regulator of protease activity HflC (stomatin/prohibitin superfamily)
MILLLIVGLIVLVAGWTFRGASVRPETRRYSKPAIIGGMVIILASIILGSLTTVPAGHKGVVVRFGAVTGRILDEGLNTRLPFIDEVKNISVQSFKHEVPASSASVDLQDVATTIAINYHINGLYADEVFRTLGHTDISDYVARFADPAIQETVKRVTAQYLAEDLILKREEVKREIGLALTSWLQERWIETEIVSITDFKFSEVFTASIEAKVAAVQAVLEAINTLERIKVEAEQREAQAIGEANARIAQAEGEAEFIQIVTAAQVAANLAIVESLSPEVLQYILLDRLGEDIKIIVIPGDLGLDIVLPELTPMP